MSTRSSNKARGAKRAGEGLNQPARLSIEGLLWVSTVEGPLGGPGRMALLQAVAEQGSITRAAAVFGISYKAAWHALDRMNRLAGAPLMARATGGRGGGRTTLTPLGERLVARFAQVEAVHRRFLQRLDATTLDLGREFTLRDVVNLRTSARNTFVGRVAAIRSGAAVDAVEVALDVATDLLPQLSTQRSPHLPPVTQARITAHITPASTAALALAPGAAVLALVKAPAVSLKRPAELPVGARRGSKGAAAEVPRPLEGVVTGVRPLAGSALEVEVRLGPEVAAVALAPASPVAWRPGDRVALAIDPAQVILAVLA